MRDVSRRSFVQANGLAALGVLAGCSTDESADGSAETPEGDVVMAYDSEDGSEWRPIGRQTIPFDGPIDVGLVVCSRFPGERCRSTFDRIQALELSDSL